MIHRIRSTRRKSTHRRSPLSHLHSSFPVGGRLSGLGSRPAADASGEASAPNAQSQGDRRPAKGRLSDKALAVIAMLLSGYTDLSMIAHATGLPLNKVVEIESADDPRVRQILSEGLPPGFVFRIRNTVKCRYCGARINLIPCVRCS